MRKDIFELIDYVTQKAEIIILTNGTLLEGEILEKLSKYDPEKLKLQISLDGSTPEINDSLRGKGSFETISRSIKKAASLGILSSVTTVVTAVNLGDLPHITELIARLGGKIHHLLWLHPRGRAQDGTLSVSAQNIIKILSKLLKKAKSLGVVIDNFESIKKRIDGSPGVKMDLSNACYTSLCLYSDGRIFPSAALVGVDDLSCGNVWDESLENIWRGSKVCHEIRSQTVEKKASCRRCQLKFICGGGDTDYSLSYSLTQDQKGLPEKDPYCPVYKYLIEEALFELARTGRRYVNTRSGYNSPIIYHAMGENSINCSSGSKKIFQDNSMVDTLHSNCVLSFDIEKPREIVREFYSKAAEKPQDDLCCPSAYPGDEISHIPKEVIDRFYGCGGPISLAQVKEKETVVDLGSGAGIDCFIAAKKVGRKGRVIGIDMTDEMLRVANKNKALVAKNLGYDVVEFKKGYLEEIAVESKSVDLVTSNCVINLSPNKRKVFSEIWRILKDCGRLLVSDIVSDTKLPPHLKANAHLWGECLAGALTEEEFLTYLEQAGFYGIAILKKEYWKEVEGFKFYSITLRGYKFNKTNGCIYRGQKAIYQGSFKAVVDEEGHLFPRGEEIEVCTDTAAKLKNYPYQGQFTIIEPDGTRTGGEVPCCAPEGGPC